MNILMMLKQKIRTLAGRQLRELERNLSHEANFCLNLKNNRQR